MRLPAIASISRLPFQVPTPQPTSIFIRSVVVHRAMARDRQTVLQHLSLQRACELHINSRRSSTYTVLHTAMSTATPPFADAQTRLYSKNVVVTHRIQFQEHRVASHRSLEEWCSIVVMVSGRYALRILNYFCSFSATPTTLTLSLAR